MAPCSTPDFLYQRGLVFPKVADCGDHDWYTSTAELERCYQYLVARESRVAVLEAIRELRKGNRLDGLTIRELIDEGRR
jgi:hypothetical protein